jgi:hypothetical protein
MKTKMSSKFLKSYLSITILVIAIATSGMFAQKKDIHASLTKKEKKEYEYEKKYQAYKSMIEQKDFVFEANFYQDVTGRFHIVDSQLNFVAVDSTTATIQLGSDSREGYNGVGGITIEGKITRWILTEDAKNMILHLHITVWTQGDFYDLKFKISPKEDTNVLIEGIMFIGELLPSSESTVFEGIKTEYAMP